MRYLFKYSAVKEIQKHGVGPMQVFKTDDHRALDGLSPQGYRNGLMKAGTPELGAHFGHCRILE